MYYFYYTIRCCKNISFSLARPCMRECGTIYYMVSGNSAPSSSYLYVPHHFYTYILYTSSQTPLEFLLFLHALAGFIPSGTLYFLYLDKQLHYTCVVCSVQCTRLLYTSNQSIQSVALSMQCLCPQENGDADRGSNFWVLRR